MSQTPTWHGECSECGKVWPDWDLYKRQGRLFGRCCLLKKAERRAYEKWFVDPNS